MKTPSASSLEPTRKVWKTNKKVLVTGVDWGFLAYQLFEDLRLPCQVLRSISYINANLYEASRESRQMAACMPFLRFPDNSSNSSCVIATLLPLHTTCSLDQQDITMNLTPVCELLKYSPKEHVHLPIWKTSTATYHNHPNDPNHPNHPEIIHPHHSIYKSFYPSPSPPNNNNNNKTRPFSTSLPPIPSKTSLSRHGKPESGGPSISFHSPRHAARLLITCSKFVRSFVP